MSMPRQIWVWIAVIISAALGCGGAQDRNRHGDAAANALVCEGERWINSEMMLAEVTPCTVITGNLSITSGEMSMELPVLTRIDGFLVVWSNPMLTHFALPMLRSVGDRVDVSYNAVLTSLELPALETANEHAASAIWDLSISDNALLPTCQANAIRDQLLARGFHGSIGISGNRGTCPP